MKLQPKITVLVHLALFGVAMAQTPPIPPDEASAKAALEKSPRHGEWIEINSAGRATPIKAYVVYPEVKEKAPVVVVIHEIFGLTDWIRAVADQLAADGFIAIAPDLLSGMGGEELIHSPIATMSAKRSASFSPMRSLLRSIQFASTARRFPRPTARPQPSASAGAA